MPGSVAVDAVKIFSLGRKPMLIGLTVYAAT